MYDIYFDHAATTKTCREAFAKANEVLTDVFANPSSLHAGGVQAERCINESAKAVAGLLGVLPEEIVFTSGGTESNNMAVLGVCNANAHGERGIVANKAEHASVTGPVAYLQSKGFHVTNVPLCINGIIDMGALERAVEKKTALVTLMQVNNETGSMQDIDAVGKMIKKINPDALFHVDGVQGFGKHPVNLRHVDLYTMSAHKIHGLKGTGALYVKKGVRLAPLFYGGGQQQGRRPGTENTAGIVAFAVAAQKSFENMRTNLAHVQALKDAFIAGLGTIGNVHVNGCIAGDENHASPYIVNASFLRVKAEALLNALSAQGIYVATGASCHSKKTERNILRHYGLPQDVTSSAIRFSFSYSNTLDEVEICLRILAEQTAFLRKFAK